MALVVKDRVRETSTTTGTGTFTLAGAVSGFQTFSSAIGNTNTTYYTIIGGTEWETGLGTVAAGTLARTTVLESSNAGSAVNFSAGTKDVFGTYPASKALYKDASGNAIGLGTVAATTTLTSAVGLPLSTGVTGTLPIANGGTGTTSTTFTNLTTNVTGTLPVANGGTSLATLTANNVLLGNGTSAPTFVAPSTSGNLLTSNGTTWTSSTPATPNTAGGATQTTTGSNITLTSASNRVQEIIATAAINVTLPDATTLSTGGPTYIISNNSFYTITLKNNAGAAIGYVAAGTAVNVNLTDNTTANGTWELSNLPVVATQSDYVQFDSNVTSYKSWAGAAGFGNHANFALSSTSVLTVYSRTATTLYAVVGTISGSTITYGTPTLVATEASGYYYFDAITLSSTQAIINLSTSAAANAVYGLTISGTTITVSTISARVGAISSYGTMGMCRIDNNTALVAYYTNTAATLFAVNTITHNGASAPTWGTASSNITTDSYMMSVGMVQLTATTYQIAYETVVTTTFATRIVTTSGVSAPTLGTALSVTVSQNNNYLIGCNSLFAYSATETGLFYGRPSGAGAKFYYFAVSGTTITLTGSGDSTAYPILTKFNNISDSMGKPSWATTTTALTCNLYDIKWYKLTYATGGNVSGSAIGVIAKPHSDTFYVTSVAFLTGSTYYATVYNYSAGSGYGLLLTLQ